MAAILYRYARSQGRDVSARADLSAYADAEKISPYAVGPMQWGLCSGPMPAASSAGPVPLP